MSITFETAKMMMDFAAYMFIDLSELTENDLDNPDVVHGVEDIVREQFTKFCEITGIDGVEESEEEEEKVITEEELNDVIYGAILAVVLQNVPYDVSDPESMISFAKLIREHARIAGATK